MKNETGEAVQTGVKISWTQSLLMPGIEVFNLIRNNKTPPPKTETRFVIYKCNRDTSLITKNSSSSKNYDLYESHPYFQEVLQFSVFQMAS